MTQDISQMDCYSNVRIRNSLRNLGIKYIEELQFFRQSDLICHRMPNFGRKSLYQLLSECEARGIIIGSKFDDDLMREAMKETYSDALRVYAQKVRSKHYDRF